jgi:glutaredoxin
MGENSPAGRFQLLAELFLGAIPSSFHSSFQQNFSSIFMQQLFSLIGRSALVLAIFGCSMAPQLNRPTHATSPNNRIAAAITTQSGAAEIALAEHLTKSGVKMYGASWCGYCHKQKQAFGAAAWAKVTYVECVQGSANANPQACQKAGIRSYPTWEINGKQYAGTMSLFRLAKYSGYTGSTAFQNSRALS